MKVREIECILALLFSVSLLPMAAQTVAGSISGTVVEQSGAVIAGARVTATNVGQKVSQATTTDRNGSFVFPQLNPSTYALTVQAPGFKKVEQENVVLNANTNISVGKIELAVGATDRKSTRL